MRLLTFGCSFTRMRNRTELTFWPDFLLDEIPQFESLRNNGAGGSGNDRFFRRVLGIVSEEMADGHKPEDLFVAVQWSLIRRKEFYSYDRQLWYRCTDTYRPEKESPETLDAINKHMRYLTHDVGETIRTLSYVLGTQSYLKSLGINHLFFYGFAPPYHTVTTNEECLSLTRQMDQNHILWGNPIRAMYEWMSTNHPDKFLEDARHPNDDGHKVWAQEILTPKVHELLGS